jgi:hypothetical protein
MSEVGDMLTASQMECAQINVVGGTGTANPATVSFPGAYKVRCPERNVEKSLD